jgi:phosphate-selective porin OprO/OprP
MRLLFSMLLVIALPSFVAGQTAIPQYRNDLNPVIQRIALTGSFQLDAVALSSDEGDQRAWNIRRLRIGERITLFRVLTFTSEVDLDPQRHSPLYVRFGNFYVQWAKSEQVVLTVGKQSPPFTLDGATSSRELLTTDRSTLATNIYFTQVPGVSVSGKRAPWIYRVGVYTSGEMNREFGEFNGGRFVLGVLGYDFAPSLGAREALLTGSYVHQNPDRRNTFTRQLENIGSLTFRFERTKWGARTDFSAASGYLGQSDLRAFQAMPFFNATPKLQFVGRYTFITGDEPNGIRLATYERRVVPGRGDEYNELYLGANYFFYGHRLKLQSGVQMAEMKDRANDGGEYTGVAWITGLRVGW